MSICSSDMKKIKNTFKYKILITIELMLIYFLMSGCKGQALDLYSGSYLGDPTIEDGGGSRGDGSAQIYTVTTIVEATNEIPSWTATDLPFTGPRRSLGVTATDSQWPFEFNYSYPANNYNLGDARLLLVTARDNSDTEGIFVDGVFTGRPPASFVSGVSSKITHRNYSCSGTCSGATAPTGTANTFFMDWALTHYKIGTQNTFDLNIASLLTSTPLAISDVISDGVFRVVTGDDAFVETTTASATKPLLILEGYTVSNAALTCTTSPVYKYKNTYIHNDGNSILQSAFSGTVLSPFNSSSSPYSTFRTVEFYYDPKLPKLSSYDGLNISKAEITLQIKRSGTGATAIVVNGIGIDQAGFDRSLATSAVESWSSTTATIDYWNSLVNAVPSTNTQTTVTLNLLSLFTESKLKEILLQGKLNIALAGPVATIYGQGQTSSRTYGVSVNGPEFILEGNYTAQLCQVPDDPNSPLNGGVIGPINCVADLSGPAISSINVSQITATSARIQWLTSEPASSLVGYGVSGPTTATPLNATSQTFHSVDLTGLSPYKYYQFNVQSSDGCTNQTTSNTNVFRTQR